MPRCDNSCIFNCNDHNRFIPCICTGSYHYKFKNFPCVLTMWRAERIIGRVEGNDGYTEIIHSVVGGAVMVELLLTLVAKHGKH